MALISCHECGKEISDKAPACPQCGAPNTQKLLATNHPTIHKARLRLGYIALCFVGLMSLIAVMLEPESSDTRTTRTRVSYEMNGKLKVLFNPTALSAMKVRDEWGRYLTWTYYTTFPPRSWWWTAQADCQDYTIKVKNFHGVFVLGAGRWADLNKTKKEYYLAKKPILDEFCPQMNRLVEEAKRREKYGSTLTAFEYPPANQVNNQALMKGLSNSLNSLNQNNRNNNSVYSPPPPRYQQPNLSTGSGYVPKSPFIYNMNTNKNMYCVSGNCL